MFLLMLFMFCFFLGFVAMFFYLLRRLDEQIRGLNDEHAQLRVLLRAMEARLEKMGHMERINSLFQGQMESNANSKGMMEEANLGETASRDPLLHLSFEQPLGENVGQKLDLTPEPKNWDLNIPVPEK